MNASPNDPQEKKIIVDEDWKAQVEAEKEALEKGQAATSGTGGRGAEAEMPLPPPSLPLLATTFAMQTMVALGLVPHPATGKAEVHLDQAKHFIDTIQLLWDKTEGNRTPEETASLDSILHEMRLAFLAVQEKSG